MHFDFLTNLNFPMTTGWRLTRVNTYVKSNRDSYVGGDNTGIHNV